MDEGTDSGGSSLSRTGRRLLREAAAISRRPRADGEAPAPLTEFVQIYREWITADRGRMGTQQQQAEGWQLICHAMISAADIAEAVRLLVRFGKVVWGEWGPSGLREEGDRAVLMFSEPHRAGAEGLIAAIWPLALTLCELEFLADTRFRDASGRVRHDACLDDGIVRLLFAQPIRFEAGEIALEFDRRHLARPVVARPTDLSRFFGELLPLTLGVRRQPPSMAALAAGLIRDDKRGPDYRESDLEGVAKRLDLSASSLRRRLSEEGTGFRRIKEGIQDELARDWLRQGDAAIEEIARRLGFSDGFSFRRFFRRMNGVPPSAYRAAATEAKAPAACRDQNL